jgi:hypothetical protein
MIVDRNGYFELFKNPLTKPIDRLQFKDIGIEFGLADSNRVKIRRFFYPKGKYTRKDVTEIDRKTQTCPWCRDGKPLSTYKNSLYKDLNNPFHSKVIKKFKGDSMANNLLPKIKAPTSLFSILDKVTKNPSLNSIWGANILSGLLGMPLSWGLSELGKRIAEFGIAIIGGIVTNLPQMRVPPRLKGELNVFFSRFMAAAIDPSPAQIQALRNDFEKLKSAVRFGRPADWWATFVSPLDSLKNAFQSLGQSFGVQFGRGANPPVAPSTFLGQSLLESTETVFAAQKATPTAGALNRVGMTFK